MGPGLSFPVPTSPHAAELSEFTSDLKLVSSVCVKGNELERSRWDTKPRAGQVTGSGKVKLYYRTNLVISTSALTSIFNVQTKVNLAM